MNNEREKVIVETVSLKEYFDLKNQYESQIAKINNNHVREIIELRSQLNETAIHKAEIAVNERMESSNNKFGLLKEQATEFVTKNQLMPIEKQLSILTRMVYVGLGGIIVLEFILRFFHHP